MIVTERIDLRDYDELIIHFEGSGDLSDDTHDMVKLEFLIKGRPILRIGVLPEEQKQIVEDSHAHAIEHNRWLEMK